MGQKTKDSHPEPQKQIIDPNDCNEYTQCQACMRSLIGRKIPDGVKQGYGEFTHVSRLIPYVMDVETEMVSHWQCPHCGHMFPRFA